LRPLTHVRVRIPRPPAIHRPPMHPLAALSLLVNLAAAAAYPWGTDSCGPPIHGSGSSTDTTGLTIKMDGSKVVLASTRGSFKGFYMQATQNLAWSNTPAGASRAHTCCHKSLTRTKVPPAATCAAAQPTQSSSKLLPLPNPLFPPTSPARSASPFPLQHMSSSRSPPLTSP
jgi:hypothetical protein